MIDLSPYVGIIYFGLFVTLVASLYFFILLIENYHDIKKEQRRKGVKGLKRYPFVSIIMTTYNEEATIKETIESLLNLNYPKNKMEIIVIDQSKDNTFKILKSFKDKRLKCKWVPKFGVPNEKSACLNLALKMAKGEFIITQDADSFIEKDALLKMLPYFEEDRRLGALIPNMKVHNPKNWVQRLQYVEYMFVLFTRKLWQYVNATFVTPGPFSIFRRSALKKIGYYFDVNSLTEDLEIAFRLLKHRYKVKCCLTAEVTTVCPDSLKALFKQRIRQNLGFLQGIMVHRELLSPKYGDLGLFVLPINILTPFLLIISFGYIMANIIAGFINNAYLVSKVGADILISKAFENLLTFRFIYSDLFYLATIVSILGWILFLILRKHCKSFLHTIEDIIIYLIYITISGFLYTTFWIVTFYRFSRKKIVWEKYDKKRIKW